MKKQTVGVFFGSRSTEHDVSVVTAIASVIKPLELSGKYDVVPVYIAKDGKWFADKKLGDIKLFTSGKVTDWCKKHKPVQLSFADGLKLAWPGLKNRGVKIDIAFPALHGTHGEDGEVMAMFELANIPYVGCDVRSSVVAMDKVLAKQVALANNISTPLSVNFAKYEFGHDADALVTKINRTLKYPLFVKPAHLGSSIGITRVTDPKDLQNAIEVAVHYDDKALVEEAVPNLIEVTLPIMGNDEPQPALLEQPLTQPEDFFDFNTKYMSGGKKGGQKSGAKGAQGYSQVPADLPKELYKKAEALGVAVYKALGCTGMARVDMLIDSTKGEVYFNEVNPLPGSLYSHNWNKAGVSNVELVTKLVELALERFEARKMLETVFSTSYLQQF
ncbi:MAG TPA: D-alanine--D-alanine ligase family protein [Candidatus Saccharimonadales bacterium]|jgi:D-alanine-D-alanine ligase